ncbi:MAG: helix-hairpin-helix domain-containing protein, partial [Bacteroidales bacterium]|nr:helix-hairpin-helix domain-containing protein [Bacteroidales bacterium]
MRRGIIAWLVLCAGRVLFCIEARSEPESGEFCRNTGVVKAGRVACDDTLKQETGIRELPEELLMKLLQLYENGEGPGEEYSEELADFFRQALDRPLNINNIELKDLDKFFFLSSFQKEAILEYRREYGEFVSLNELFNIPGIERWQAELMLPFISPQGGGELLPLNLPALWRDARIQLLSRFKFIPEKQQGFTPVSREEYQKKPDCRYAGAPGYLYAQLKYECRDLVKICITSEKDPGEPGVDYLSASLLLHTKGVTERIVAGSYSARFGQGLVLWNSFPATLETQPSSLCKKESAILPYNSTGENDSFCGVAVTLRFKESDISIMTSYRGYDARITEEGFTSLLTTGLHNTATTFSRRKNLYGTVAGFNLNYRGSGFTVSQTTLLYRYDHPYAGRDSVKIKKWGEAGAWGGNASLSWYKVCKRVRVFGELAFDHGASAAVIAG